jgi:hypothetical protein
LNSHSPSEVRAAALAGLVSSATPRRRGLSEQVEFGELLHGY